MTAPTARGTALVTGATGHVGGRLVPVLLDDGWDVRVLARRPEALERESWIDDVDVVTGDVGDRAALVRALSGVRAAYYLVHSMSATYDYAARDRELARGFAAAAAEADVSRIVYLSGLQPRDEPLTPHLASRREVGQVFLDGDVPTAVLQAGIVIGPGSASYEMLGLAARQPVVVGPTWLHHRVQPVALQDALLYLLGAASLPSDVSRTFDIGGPDAVTYAELVQTYADVAGHRRPKVVTIPVLLPRTASLWAGILTPGPTSLTAALVHSLTVDMVCHEHDLDAYVDLPPGRPLDVRQALQEARGVARSGRKDA